MGKIWLVTGASRGLGREITRAALDSGETVVATARSADAVRDAFGGEHDRLHALALDITDAEAANAVAAETIERFGAIDVLVNNAGYAELGFFETFTDAAVRRQFEVNLFGTMNVARAVVPHMRERRSGLIVTISSVSGLVSNGGGAVYSASKFAVEGWMEGFAQELAPLGVRSLLVEPGMLRTDFMDGKSARFGSIDIPDYAEAIAQYRAFVDGAIIVRKDDEVVTLLDAKYKTDPKEQDRYEVLSFMDAMNVSIGGFVCPANGVDTSRFLGSTAAGKKMFGLRYDLAAKDPNAEADRFSSNVMKMIEGNYDFV